MTTIAALYRESVSDILGKDKYTFSDFWNEWGFFICLGIVLLILLFCFLYLFVFSDALAKRAKEKEKQKVFINGTYVFPSDVCTITLLEFTDIRVIKGEEFIAPIHTKEGYLFSGWFYDSACTDPYKTKRITKDITLYPKWTKDS